MPKLGEHIKQLGKGFSFKFLILFAVAIVGIVIVKYVILVPMINYLNGLYVGKKLDEFYDFFFVILAVPNIIFYSIIGVFLAAYFKKYIYIFLLCIFEVCLLFFKVKNSYFFQADIFDYLLIIFPGLMAPLSILLGSWIYFKFSSSKKSLKGSDHYLIM